MSVATIGAKKCSIENRDQLNPCGSAEEREKWNLYEGLAALADALRKLENDLDDLGRQVA